MEELTPSQKLDSFFTTKRKLLYKKRDIILRSDDNPSGVIFLKKGYVRVFAGSENGDELTFTIYTPGDIFPITWTINGTENIHSYEAITDVEVYRSQRSLFIEFLKTNADVLLLITSLIVHRYSGYLIRMEQMVFGNTYKRVGSIFVILADRYGVKKDGATVIPISLTHKDIASMLGIARETASIEIEKLEKQRMLKLINHQFTITNLQKLKEIL